MINIAIWTSSPTSQIVNKLIISDYNSLVDLDNTLNLSAYVEPDANDHHLIENIPVISIQHFIQEYKAGNISALIIPIDIFNGNNGLILYLLELGIDIQDVYLFNRLNEYIAEDALNCITQYIYKDYLPYLEYHITDHCNLNCKACEHYSSLVTHPVFACFDEFKLGLSLLKQRISDIGTIRLLGGEPLLNPEINRFIEYTRHLYPKSDIYIVTNGSLITRMDSSFFSCVKANSVCIAISHYKPFSDMIDIYKSILDGYNINYTISDCINYFGIRQTLTPSKDYSYFYRCLPARCNFLQGCFVGACYMPFLTKYFNKYFESELEEVLPEDGSIDLRDENLTTELLKIKLLMPFDRCKYCTDGQRIDWEIIGTTSKLSDWII